MSIVPVVFNNTVLRDGHQSLAATRMSTRQMEAVAPLLDTVGFGALETWGGATIDSGVRFLSEFPFARLDALKRLAPKTPHMMLLRGQNIVQYTNFPDDVVEAFVAAAARHGMDIFRVFDALNDLRNIETAIRAVKKAGRHAQGTVCYTTSPVHTPEMFIELGVQIEAMGCDSICVKDMAGLLPPYVAYQIVRGLKARVKIPVIVHTHETAGFGAAAYYAAIEAGADAVDTSISPFANGTGQPDTWRMLQALSTHPRRPGYDAAKLLKLREELTRIYAELSAYTSHRNEVVDNDALTYQVPGGMLSNFRNQLKEQKMADRFAEVMQEMPYVRQCLGWIPLVTPTSQIVGVQAMLNVKFGRWKNFSPEAMKIALGYYGRTPGPIDPEVLALAEKLSGKPRFTGRPADALEPRMPKLRAELAQKGLPADDEHGVIYAMFPQEVEKLYRADAGKAAAPGPKPEIKTPEPAQPVIPGTGKKISRLALTIDGRRHQVSVEEVG
ncbi:MAG: pyruvate carboxylase subunit B [Opitutaceae bacterium]|nr:pyruvate carboxylase subunit B [Opitutaceae bacterium]